MDIDRTQQPVVNDMEPFPVAQPKRRIMANGVPLSVIAQGDQEVVRLDIIINAGRWQQSKPLQATFTTRMLREGSKQLSGREVAERLDFYGARLELYTGVSHSQLTLYCLYKYFDQTAAIVESILKEPAFPQDRVDTVLQANRQQYLINQKKVSFLGRKALRLAAFGPGHPLGMTEEEWDYDRLTPGMLREFYTKYYHSGNCSVFLSGFVGRDVEERVEQLFGRGAWGEVRPYEEPEAYPICPTKARRTFLEKADALQSCVLLGWHTLRWKEPDFLKLRVLITVFGGYFGSRLMSNIREDKGYTYGISARILDFPDTGLGIVACETATANVEPLIGEVYREMERLRTELIGEEELDMVRNYLLGEMARSYEGAFSLADAWINFEWAELPAAYPERSMRAVKDVTAEELRGLAQKYLTEEGVFEIVAGRCNP